jgi:hypothetical protein
MKSPKQPSVREDARPEYDFSKGVRGKYAKAYAQGSNIVVLDPELAALFPDSRSVNEALRVIARLAKRHSKKAS